MRDAEILSFIRRLHCLLSSGEDQKDTAGPVTKSYATQINAPSPDYRTLLNQPSVAFASRAEREGSAPLPSNAKVLGDLWIARLNSRDALLGYGLAGKSPDGPVEMIDTGLTEKEFASWTAKDGWQVAEHIRWSFVSAMTLPQVSDAAKTAIRVWPASVARTGMQHQAGYSGRVELRDGCFFVGQFGEPVDKLAWFHAEIGLDRDKAGFLYPARQGKRPDTRTPWRKYELGWPGQRGDPARN